MPRAPRLSPAPSPEPAEPPSWITVHVACATGDIDQLVALRRAAEFVVTSFTWMATCSNGHVAVVRWLVSNGSIPRRFVVSAAREALNHGGIPVLTLLRDAFQLTLGELVDRSVLQEIVYNRAFRSIQWLQTMYSSSEGFIMPSLAFIAAQGPQGVGMLRWICANSPIAHDRDLLGKLFLEACSAGRAATVFWLVDATTLSTSALAQGEKEAHSEGHYELANSLRQVAANRSALSPKAQVFLPAK